MASIAEEVAKPAGSSVIGRLRERLATSDPAYSRLRMASKALLSLLIAGALLAGFSFLVAPLPIAAYGLAVVITFTASMAIRDASFTQQVLSRTYAWIVTTVCVFIASLLAPIPLVADLAFLVVIFGAVYIRTYGLRWFAVGMIAFMAYFMGDYLQPKPSDIGWLAFAGALAFAVTQLVAGTILRDDPERDFRRALVTIDQRIEAILRALIAGPKVDRPAMQEQLSRLRDIVLMAEGFIPQGEVGSLAARGPASELAVALFDLQLIVERMARASYIAPPPPELVRALIDERPAPVGADDGTTARLLLRVGRARTRLAEVLGPLPSPAFAPIKNDAPVVAKPAAGTAATKGPPIPLAWQLPIQVTLACAIAMAAGHVASPTRWYWAVITAFIVFNNAKSRADTAMRALQRTAGTLAGLVGGTLLATLMHGQTIASAIAIPVLFFVAFYYLQVSYGLMIFLVTLALALLYGLMGMFSPDLLVERLIETVIGSVAGAGVAFLIFPARTSESVAAALDKYLSALRDLVAAAKGRALREPEPLHILARSRLLDKAYAELATTARAIGGRWGAVTRFGEVRERLLILSGAAHWSRVLARSLPPDPSLTAEQSARIGELIAEVDARIDAASAVKDSFFERPEGDDAENIAPRPPLPISEDADPVFALEAISSLIRRATPARG
jgi:uncharacterized membrane protein YccC